MLIATVTPQFGARVDDQVWITFRDDRMHLFDGATDVRLG
jgi:hypothetical protein